jgi:hypothetical protein
MKRASGINSDIRASVRPPSAPVKDELAGRVRQFLHERAPDCDLIAVEAIGGTVILHGHVPSPHAKWVCLQCCRHVAGVRHVIDELTIDEPEWRTLPR